MPAPRSRRRWASHFKIAKINYQPVGSGAGQAAIKAGTGSFGGSDAPLSTADLSKYGLVQFPSCVGGLVAIVNLPGIGSGRLKLDGTTLTGIYLGTITTWNNNAIKTHYLSAVNGTWASKVGANMSVRWPNGLGANGSAGVAAAVKQATGRIGYVEYAYALQARIPYVQMKNKAGQFVSPSLRSFSAAASNARWSPSDGFAANIVNAAGSASWPISGPSFVIMKKNTAASTYATIHAALQYFDWGYKSGKADASALQYVSMPSSVVGAVEKMWHSSIKAGTKAAW